MDVGRTKKTRLYILKRPEQDIRRKRKICNDVDFFFYEKD